MSGSFASVQWNACVHRLNLSLYSHPKDFWGNGVRTHVNSKGNIPVTGRSEEDQTCNPASCTTVSPTHNPLSYSCPESTLTLRSSYTLMSKRDVSASGGRRADSSLGNLCKPDRSSSASTLNTVSPLVFWYSDKTTCQGQNTPLQHRLSKELKNDGTKHPALCSY